MAEQLRPSSSLQSFQNREVTPTRAGGQQRSGGWKVPDQTGSEDVNRWQSPALEVQERFGTTGANATNAHNKIMQTISQRKRAQLSRAGHGTGSNTIARVGVPTGSAGGWGGAYGLQKNAAAAFNQMSSAYAQRWGAPISVTEGGRTYDRQAELYRMYLSGTGNLAAPPGTSTHETGRALDLGGPFTSQYSPQHQWLQSIASQYGFAWTGGGFSQIEPWHWDYVGS